MITDVIPSEIPLDNVFIPAIANGLASLGRYEDTYMVHAAKGETVVPKEVLDANPGLKDELFRQMIDMGIENPKRYVVGERLNSINPITGQPEFFFKSIKKFFKQAAPTIGAVVGGTFGPWGAAIGSGLGSKLAGQSTEQALLNAALAGGSSYVLGGGLHPSAKQLAEGVKPGVFAFNPEDASTALGGLVGKISGGLPSIIGDELTKQIGTKGIASALGGGLGSLAGGFLTEPGESPEAAQARAAALAKRREVVGAGIRDRELARGNKTLAQFPGQDIRFLTPEQLALIRETKLNERFRALSTKPAKAVAAVPSEQEQEMIDRMLAGGSVSQQQFPLDVVLEDVTPTQLFANQGIYVPGDQTQNRDTVPAMLTPGEFVFTREAVQGAAPNGTRQDQARAMYGMMRDLEGRA